MPRKGWKSITVKASVYEYFWREWEKRAEEYRLKHGITSFSGFITKRLFEMMEEEQLFIREEEKLLIEQQKRMENEKV